MEIERKFLIKELPKHLPDYKCLHIEQAYLNTEPVIRVRRQDEEYYMTYKSKGFLSREEYNLPLNAEAYEHLKEKADGNVITKKRYCIPYENDGNENLLMIELDIFEGCFEGIMLAEVEFSSEEEAHAFMPPAWFGEEVTYDTRYHNSTMSKAVL